MYMHIIHTKARGLYQPIYNLSVPKSRFYIFFLLLGIIKIKINIYTLHTFF